MPKMTRAHFKLVADAVKECPMDEHTRVRVAASLADSLRRTNDTFDRRRFIEACGVDVD